MLRRHRLVEAFLVEVLKLDWSEVHTEAELLEHAISDKVLEKIDELIGRPRVDPHGDPIPTNRGEIDDTRFEPLAQRGSGERLRVARVIDQDAGFLQFAERSGLVPGAELVVERPRPASRRDGGHRSGTRRPYPGSRRRRQDPGGRGGLD